eukprot:1140407-Pelagomonas_calceolata.AAC.2
MGTNPYPELHNAYPHLCCALEIIPSQPPIMLLFPSGSANKSCSHTNPGAYKSLLSGILNEYSERIRSNKNKPTSLTDLHKACETRDVSEACWWKTSIKSDPVLDARQLSIETGFKKFEKLPSDQQHSVSPKNIVRS